MFKQSEWTPIVPWSLLVKTTNPLALPKPQWSHILNGMGNIFGFNLAYYNPNPHCQMTHPQLFPEQNIGIFKVSLPFPEVPTCEISRLQILELLLLQMEPGEVSKLLATGYVAVEKAAKAYYVISAPSLFLVPRRAA